MEPQYFGKTARHFSLFPDESVPAIVTVALSTRVAAVAQVSSE
jgi:hypothetical protein